MGNISKVDLKIDDIDSTQFVPGVREIIDIIDKNNAVSSIGTLEFLDKISKYFTTEIICDPYESEILEGREDDKKEEYINGKYIPYEKLIQGKTVIRPSADGEIYYMSPSEALRARGN